MESLKEAINSFNKNEKLRPTTTEVRYVDGSVFRVNSSGQEEFLEKVDVDQTVTSLVLPLEEKEGSVDKKTEIKLPWTGLQAFTLDEVLSEEECQRLIAVTERVGYVSSKVNVSGKLVVLKGVVDSASCVIEDASFTAKLFERIKSQLPLILSDPTEPNLNWQGEACGINPLLRCLRYGTGTEGFTSHRDNSTKIGDDQRSLLTIVLYMNEGYTGGETRFCQQLDVHAEEKDVIFTTPVTCGSLLLFHHDCIHDVAAVLEGTKYAMRTDVLYRRIDSCK
eukprot:Awhi_evm1s978